MIEYDGPGPRIPHEEAVKPASGFERLVARSARFLGGSKKMHRELIQAVATFEGDATRRLALAGCELDDREEFLKASAMEEAVRRRGAFGASAVELFLSLGADPDRRHEDASGVERGLATLALRSGQWEGAKLLLAKSRHPFKRDGDGLGVWGAFALGAVVPWAARSWNFPAPDASAASWISTLGADPNERLVSGSGLAPAGATPLALAASCWKAVKALLDAGADPNMADDEGVTPLMRVASHRGPDALLSIPALLAAGARPQALDHQGRDALWWMIRADSLGNQGLPQGIERHVQLLLDAGVARMERSRFEGARASTEPPKAWESSVRAMEESQALDGCSRMGVGTNRSRRL